MHDETESSSGIRRPAEQERSDDATGCRSETEEQDSNKLMEELRVHQAELEMQNEELRCVRQGLARSRDRFHSLFHQAPVGYVALDASGMIQEANEAFLRMAGAPREAVMGAYFHSLLEQSHASVFRGRFKALLKKPLGKVMEVRLLRPGKPLWIRIEASDGQAVDHPAGGEPPALLLILSDITEEKLAEEALREEQRRLNFVIEGSGLGTWEWNLQTNETVFNETWAEIIGYALDELTPCNLETWERLTHPEDLARARKALASCIGEETPDYECELRMRHKAGHWVWILDRGRVMTWDAHGRPLLMFGTHSDITPRKLLEEERERLLERVTEEKRVHQSLFEASKTVLEGGDFASTARRIFDAARALTAAQSGYVALLSDDGEENELLFLEAGGLPCLVNPDLPMPIRGLRAEAYKTGSVVLDNDFMHSRWASFMPPGHVDLGNVMFAPLNVEGKTVGIMGLANKLEDFNEDDVVVARAFGQLAAIALQKNRNLDALRDSEQRFRSFVENANDIVYALSLEGLFTYLSPNWIDFVGEPAEAALGRSFEPYVHPEDVHLCREFLQEVLCSGEKQSGVVYRVQRRDGTWRWHFSNGSPLFDSQGTLTGYLGIARDITEIRQAEETLKERERFLRAVLETTADGFFVLDNQGRITEANSAYCSMTGYPKDEIVGRSMPEIDAAESSEEMAARIKRVTSRGSEIFEARHRRKDGTVFPVEISTSFVPTHGGRFVCFCRDLTERKSAETRLREITDRLIDAQKFAKMGLYEIDLRENRIDCSEEFREIYGITDNQESLNYDRFMNLIHPDYRDYHENQMNRIWEFGHGEFEYPICRTNGDTRWVWAKGKVRYDEEDNPTHLIVIAQDITDRKAIEFVLQENEELFRNLFKHLTIGVAIYEAVENGEDFVFSDMNLAGQQLSKVSIDDIRGAKLTQVFPGACELGLLQSLKETWKTGEPRYVPFRRYKDDRVVQWVENRVLRLPTGKVVAVYDDRTELMRLEEGLRQAQKMEAIGTLAGGIAHDFNNMLGVILGHTEMALDETSPDEPLHEDLKEVYKAARRSSDLTRQLLAFARKQVISPKVLDLNETVEGMLKMLKRLIGEDIDLSWLPGSGLWKLRMDPSQIDQILANLCVNARDAVGTQGKIIIETKNIRLDKAYTSDRPEILPGEYVLMAVSDNGCGMDKETLSHLFEPFFTTKMQGKGTGMGLATVFGIVKQNKGHIHVYSEPGKGTSFKIYLPRHSTAVMKSFEERESKPVVGGDETILIVEDEEAMLRMAKTMLERVGYRVLAAGTPSEALVLADKHAGEISLLITDVIMPKMNGKELAERLLALYPNLATLFASGYTANVIAHHGVLDIGVHFIQKPFSLKELTTKVREALSARAGAGRRDD